MKCQEKNHTKTKHHHNIMTFTKCKSHYKNNRYKFTFPKKRISGKTHSKNLLVSLISENKYFLAANKVIQFKIFNMVRFHKKKIFFKVLKQG